MLDTKKYASISIGNIYREYLRVYEEDQKLKILLKYFGEFSINLIRNFADGIENIMAKEGDKRHIVKRMFSILIEGLQNAHIHGGKDENGEQKAFLIISQNKEEYKLTLGNILENEDKESVISYLGNINNHNEEELKQLYIAILKNGYLSKKGGAGLGIVTMRMKSSKKLKYNVYELTPDKSFLVMEVCLNRN
ncbi:MAG: SiaB family protein kinase [Crocinitomicaceae bacterium]|nr:SiaB family protein kinase [Crocinitomicaceae bacterium]